MNEDSSHTFSEIQRLNSLYGGRLPHKEEGRFYNYKGEGRRFVVGRSLYMYLASYKQRLSWLKNNDQLLGAYQHDSQDHLMWIGHASFLLQIQGLTFLIDPLFGDITFLFKRFQKPGVSIDQLPPIDAVLLTHNHRDHMDTAALRYLFAYTSCYFIVPVGDKAWFDRRGMGHRVYEVSWWDRIFLKGVEITFTPAFHWSQRGIFDRNKSLWGGYFITSDSCRIFCAGDTAYSCHFQEIRQLCGVADIAILPIAPCEPKDWMESSHLNPEDAGRAFLDLRAKVLVPMHFGTFGFGVDHPAAPLQRLRAWWKKQDLSRQGDHVLEILQVGQRYEFPMQLISGQLLKPVFHNLW